MMETARDLNMETDEMQLVVSALRGVGKRIALFPIVPDTSLLFPTVLRGVRTPLSLPMETGKI